MVRPMSPTLQRIAREELNETPERIEQDLEILRSWIGKQPHLKARTTDLFLIMFLRRCRYSLEDTKKRIELYYEYRNRLPNLRNRFVNQRILDINRAGIHIYPEFPICENRAAILISRFKVCVTSRISIYEIMKYFSMAIEIIALENDNASVAGIHQIFDMAGFSWDKVREPDRPASHNWWNWLTRCCPIRLKAIYIINCPKDLQNILSMKMTIIPWRADRFPVLIVKSMEELYTHVPRQCLPEEYGGTNGHMAECIGYLEDILKSYRSYFEEDVQYEIREELRCRGVFSRETEFGVNGSFRKLRVD